MPGTLASLVITLGLEATGFEQGVVSTKGIASEANVLNAAQAVAAPRGALQRHLPSGAEMCETDDKTRPWGERVLGGGDGRDR